MTLLRLLLIEDDEMIALCMHEVLTEHGYGVTQAATPEQALVVLSTAADPAFDLILSDAFTPPADPYRWLTLLRQATPVPIVICSAHAASAYVDHRRRGFAAYLAKPFDLDDLLRLVATLIVQPSPAGR